MSHYHAANGCHGYQYDNIETHDTEESAIDSLVELFEDDIAEESSMRENLQEFGIHNFDDPASAGAQFCTVFECSDSSCEGVFDVTCSNFGMVYHGVDETEARNTYDEYVKLSKSDSGTAAGEQVVLWFEGEPIEELEGTNEEVSKCML